MKIKAEILRLLGDAGDEALSGQKLSRRLGISRVAIWKHMDTLRQKGYRIEGTPKGYRLRHSPDIPYTWEFPDRLETLHYFDEIPSTMDIARDMARQDCSHLTTVIAGRQTQGRGRMRRKWHSEDGGLYFTMVVRPQVPAFQAVRVGFAASAAMAELVNERFGIAARVKWPNDILVDDLKLCGMLSEMDAETDRIRFANIGMGINVNNLPPGEVPTACSIRGLLGRRVSRCKLLSEFLDRFQKAMEEPSLESAVERWKRMCITLNRRVVITTTRQEHQGMAVDVDDDGALILESPDGQRERVLYGDCFHR